MTQPQARINMNIALEIQSTKHDAQMLTVSTENCFSGMVTFQRLSCAHMKLGACGTFPNIMLRTRKRRFCSNGIVVANVSIGIMTHMEIFTRGTTRHVETNHLHQASQIGMVTFSASELVVQGRTGMARTTIETVTLMKTDFMLTKGEHRRGNTFSSKAITTVGVLGRLRTAGALLTEVAGGLAIHGCK